MCICITVYYLLKYLYKRKGSINNGPHYKLKTEN